VLVIAAAAIAFAGIALAPQISARAKRAGIVAVAAAAIAGLAGPAAYAVQTISVSHSGSLPSAGPTVAGSAGIAGRFGPGGGGPGGGAPGTARGVAPQGLFGGSPPLGAQGDGPPQSAFAGSGAAGPGFALSFGAGGDAAVSHALVAALESNAGAFRWVAATTGSTTAASYELATNGDPVMAIGGFDNNGGELSLAQFIRYVRAGEIHYFIAGGVGGGPGGFGASSTTTITAWVQAHYKSETIGGATVYDLSR
jgi:hypothetical protein